MPPKGKATNQTFSFDTVVVLVATIMENGGSLGSKEFKRMSALDGTRGEHGFNHMFRDVKARAKQLTEQAKEAGELTPVNKTKGTGTAAAKKAVKTPTSGKKRGTPDTDIVDQGKADMEQGATRSRTMLPTIPTTRTAQSRRSPLQRKSRLRPQKTTSMAMPPLRPITSSSIETLVIGKGQIGLRAFWAGGVSNELSKASV